MLVIPYPYTYIKYNIQYLCAYIIMNKDNVTARKQRIYGLIKYSVDIHIHCYKIKLINVQFDTQQTIP